MKRTIQASVLVLLGWIISVPAEAESAIGWRNDGTGQFPTAKPPAEWSRDKNVLWKVALPGASFGSPIVVSDRLFVVSDPAELLCIRRSDGKVLWKKSNSDVKATAAAKGGRGGAGGGRGGPGGRGGFGGGGRGGKAGNTAATPASDGKHVAAVFGNGVVAVYDLEGKRLWGKFTESSPVGFGHAASPLLIDGKLIVHVKDLVAYEIATGKEAWRVVLPASHASPIAARLGKEEVVISPAGAIVRASDGKILSKGKFRTTQSSPVFDGDTLCVSSKSAMQAVKVSRSDSGEVSVTSLWSGDGSNERHHLPSALIHDGLFYNVAMSGRLEVIEVQTGKKVYTQRLPVNQVYSSITLAGGLLYVVDLQGKAVVFKPGRQFERVAVNQLEGTGSCPVFADDHLYLRGRQNLYCVSTKAKGKQRE